MALREVFASFGFEFDGAKLRAADAGVEGLIEKVQGLAATFASGLLVSGLNNLAAELDVFDDLSARTGIAVESLQALGLAFETNGSSAEEMQGALTRLQSSLGGLSDGGKEQAEVFKKLGIATKDAAGKAPTLNEALPQIFNNFASISSEAEQARVATTLFGRTGVKLLPVLRQGAEGFAQMHQALQDVGGGATQEATEAAGAYRDALARLHYSFFSLKGLIATAVFPRLQQVVETSAKAIGRFSAWAKETTLVDTAAGILATTLAVKLGSALAPYLKSGLKFGAIFLAIDDVVAFLRGQDSVIGALLNKVFGDGTADVVRAWVNDAIKAIKAFNYDTLRDFVTFAKRDLVGAFDRASDRVKNFARAVGPLAVILSPLFRMAVALGFAIDKLSESFAALKDEGVRDRVATIGKAFLLFQPITKIALAAGFAVDQVGRAILGLVSTIESLPDLGEKIARIIPALRLAKLLGEGAARLIIPPGGKPASGGGEGAGSDPPAASAPYTNPFAPAATTSVSPYGPAQGVSNLSFAPVTNLNISVPPGTPAQQVKAITQAARAGSDQSNRAAKQALSQRAP